MRRTNLYLDDAQTVALDEIARAQGVSRAELVRRLLNRALETVAIDLEADLAAIEDSFGTLGDGLFLGRGPDDRDAHLDRLGRS